MPGKGVVSLYYFSIRFEKNNVEVRYILNSFIYDSGNKYDETGIFKPEKLAERDKAGLCNRFDFTWSYFGNNS